jgi:hypothetical protein
MKSNRVHIFFIQDKSDDIPDGIAGWKIGPGYQTEDVTQYPHRYADSSRYTD